MITDDLIKYISTQKSRGVSESELRTKLAASGWKQEDIDEGIKKVFLISEAPKLSQSSDLYKEPITATALPVDFIPKLSKPVVTAPKAPSVEIFTPETYSPNPETAIISSYKNDSQKAKANIAQTKEGQKSFSLALIIIVLVLLFGGSVYAYKNGYVKLPFSVPFVDKNPIQVLSALPTAEAKETSWKSDSDITITSPFLAHAHVSTSFSHMPNTAVLSDSTISATSSLLNNPINTEIRTVEGTMYANIPDLSNVLSGIVVTPGWVSVSQNDINSLVALFPNTSAMYNVSSKVNSITGLLSNPTTSSAITSFLTQALSKVQVTQQPSVLMSGANVYHYTLTMDQATTQTLVQGIINIQPEMFSDNEKANLNNILQKVTINSLDVWVGKNDNLLYQYDINITTPMSNGQDATLDIKQTFSDYNVPVTVQAPDASVSVIGVIESIQANIHDQNIKSIMNTIAVNTDALFKTASYAKTAKSNGICPDLTSNIGSVGKISSYCFSTTKAWALEAPLASTSATFFCVDSTGAEIQLNDPIIGPVCK